MEKQPMAMNQPETLNFEEENQIQYLPAELQGQLEYIVVDHPYKRKFKVPPVDHNVQL